MERTPFFTATKTESVVKNSPGLMQTPVEPFIQPGFQETSKQIFSFPAPFLSPLASAQGKAQKPHRKTKAKTK